MEYIAILLSIACASFVQGAVGFGYGIIATGLLASFLDIKDASVIMILGGLAQNFTILVRLWPGFSWRHVRGLVIAAVAGVPLGVTFLVQFDTKWVLLLLGSLLIVSTVRYSVSHPRPRRLPPILSIPAGLISGFLHGAFGAGAPPAVLYAKHLNLDRQGYVATLQVILGASTLARAACMGGYGLIRSDLLATSTAGILFAFVGARLGTHVLGMIPVVWLERATTILLLALGAKYIWSAF